MPELNSAPRMPASTDPRASTPSISVVVPVFNQAPTLAATLESLRAQTCPDWECLIADDGSTDASRAISEPFLRTDSRFRYLHQANRGLPAARNLGIAAARGEFLQFLDGDDLLTPNKFSDQLAAQRESQADVLYSDYLCFVSTDPRNTGTYSRVVLRGDPVVDLAANWEKDLSIPVHCFLYRRSLVRACGDFDERMVCGKEDWDFHLRVALAGPRYHHTPGAMALYRITNTSMVRSDPNRMFRGKIMFLRKHLLAARSPFRLRLTVARRLLEEYRARYSIRQFLGLSRPRRT